MTDEYVDAAPDAVADSADGRADSPDGPDDSDADAGELADVAAEAVTAAGEYLRERFEDGTTEADYTAMDVKATADREAESRVLRVVEDAYPDHRITAEESGDHPGDGDFRWVVDALDGTNNFTVGVPTFGVAATACERDDPAASTGSADATGLTDAAGSTDTTTPVATAVAVPMLDDLYVAERGGGVRYDGDPVEATDGDAVPPSHATVGAIIGPPVLSGGAERREWDAVREAVDAVPKRVIQTWAPVVYWGLLARGKLDGFVCYYPAEREQAAGKLLAREAGCIERSDGPLTVFAADEELCEELWDAAQGALAGL